MTQEEMRVLRDVIKDVIGEEIKPLKSDISGLKEDVGGLKKDVSGLKEDVNSLQTQMDSLQSEIGVLHEKHDAMDQRLLKLEVKIENENDRTLKALSEGHRMLNRKLDENIRLESRVETLEHKMSAVEYALKQAK